MLFCSDGSCTIVAGEVSFSGFLKSFSALTEGKPGDAQRPSRIYIRQTKNFIKKTGEQHHQRQIQTGFGTVRVGNDRRRIQGFAHFQLFAKQKIHGQDRHQGNNDARQGRVRFCTHINVQKRSNDHADRQKIKAKAGQLQRLPLKNVSFLHRTALHPVDHMGDANAGKHLYEAIDTKPKQHQRIICQPKVGGDHAFYQVIKDGDHA